MTAKPMKTGFRAVMLANSYVPKTDCHLITMEVTFPRFILAEVNTHRQLSKNSASSRAIPVRKRIEVLRNTPFIPTKWHYNTRGMQGKEELSPADRELARTRWIADANHAADTLEYYESIGATGVHKQHANRVAEPYLWHTAIISGTEWANFFGLRMSALAQPEFDRIATMMSELICMSEPETLRPGQWHLPMLLPEEKARVRAIENSALEAGLSLFTLREPEIATYVHYSTARCARVSYETHDTGKIDAKRDRALADMLKTNGHMSPLEHPAQAMRSDEMVGNFRGFRQFRKLIPNESNPMQHPRVTP